MKHDRSGKTFALGRALKKKSIFRGHVPYQGGGLSRYEKSIILDKM